MRYYLYLIIAIVVPQFIYFFTDIENPYTFIYLFLVLLKESHRGKKESYNYLDSIKYIFNLNCLGKIRMTKNAYKELFLSFTFYLFGFHSIYILITNKPSIQDVLISELLLYILFGLLFVVVLFIFFFYNILSEKEK